MKTFSNRLLISLWLVIAFFVIAILKLGYVQVVKHQSYKKLATKQRNRDTSLLAKRGYIFDRNGLELAVSIKKDTVVATPYLIKEPSIVAKKLAPLLKMSNKELYEKLIQTKGFVYLKRKIDKDDADRIRKFDIEGISLFKENKRSYPQGETASQLLGFVGIDNDGLAGLELKYNSVLKGSVGRLKDEKDAFGQSIPGTKGLFNKPIDGKNLILTIDRDIQYKAQLELKNAIEENEAASGIVIVMNPKTGEIFAMASEPSFNSNKFKKASKESMKNQAVVSVYEPGSTFKIITAAAAVSEKIYKIDSMFNLPPTLNVYGKNIKEAHGRGTVNFTLSKIIAESSNVGISKVSLSLGKKRMYSYVKKFGVLEKTGIDYPGEISGYVPKPKYWYGPTIATVAFGQGIAVTPIQLARAYAAIANGGTLYRPYIANKVLGGNGKVVKTYKPKRIRRVISKESAFDATLMLESVIKEGTGKEMQIKGYSVAGKTGTAQKSIDGKYGDAYIGSFIGFAPAENAQILTLVVVDSPKKSIYGSQVAGPAFKNIMEFSLHKLKIPPE